MAKINQAMQDLMRYDYANLPKKRSLFDKSHSHATTLDSAFLVPIMWDRVVPGDEKKIRYSGLARMATPLHPVMDEAYLYTWAFYIPDRLWWSHAKEFYGENLDAEFNPDGEYRMPSIGPDRYFIDGNQGTSVQSLSDYFGMPINVSGSHFEMDLSEAELADMEISVGLWRCYQIIYNEYYRNSSIQGSVHVTTNDTVTDEEWEAIKQIRRVCKLPDQFTSLLRSPQAGDDVLLPLGEYAPVITREDVHYTDTAVNGIGLMIADPELENNQLHNFGIQRMDDAVHTGVVSDHTDTDLLKIMAPIVPTNLWTDLSLATASSINNLRAAITIQQLLELDAIGGKRYQNLIFAHFGCFTPDATLQRPELLGASKTRIGMRQVLNTAQDLGTPGAVSVTNVDNEWICNKAFTEPGFIMVLCAIRPLHSYSQGVNPLLRKLDRYQHYYPVFENIGNQPVYVSELYATTGMSDEIHSYFTEIFGWKEAWNEYRFMDNRVSGLFRPDVSAIAAGSLASWNYSTNFESKPILNSDFVSEDPELIDRTIAVQDEPQFLLDSYFEYHDIKNMGIHSKPGLTRL